MRQPLTARQQQALDFIAHCLDRRGYPPTLREIGEHMGIRSTNGVNDHLKALERKGYLQREELKSRALRPVEWVDSGAGADGASGASSGGSTADDRQVEVPLLGQVAAGAPTLAVEHESDRVVIDRFFLGGARNRDIFGLVVRGDSMIEDGIHDGDFVFVRKQPTAERGAIVVVMVDGEATCKRLYDEGARIRLQPANAAMAPMYIDKREFRSVDVLGKVIGVYRRLH